MTDEQMYGVPGVSQGATGPIMLPNPQQNWVAGPNPAPQRAVRKPAPNPLDEIEARLTLAQYYRAVLSQPLFSQSDAFAARVQAEVTEFVMGRMSELVGAGKKAGPGEFTPEEVQALKVLAQRLLAPDAPEAAPAPVAAPSPPVAAPRAPPRVAPRPPPQAPTVNPVAPPVQAEEPEEEEDYEESPEPPPPPPPPKARRRKSKTAKAPAAPPKGPQPGAGYLAIPQGTQMSAVTQMRAMETVAALENGSVVETNPLFRK